MAEVPHGANLPAPHPPGFEPVFFAVVQSFLKGKDVKEITDEIMDAILEQSEKFTLKLLKKFPKVSPVEIPTKPLPATWKAGADVSQAPIPDHWVKQTK